MRIGISGANGYLGKNLYNLLLKKKSSNEIIVFDPRKNNIPDNLNLIYHLGFGSFNQYKNNSVRTMQIDEKSAKIIGKYCKNNGTKLIFCSSAAVYEPSLNSIKEESITRPNTDYGLSKLKIENLLQDFSKSSFILIIFRLFNLYGPHQSSEFLIPQIIESIKLDKKLTIKNPNAIRDFIFLDDCLSILEKSNGKISENVILNLGSGAGINVKTAVSIIKEVNGKDIVSKVEFNKDEKYTCNFYVADMKKIKEYIGNIDFINFRKGINKIINQIN
jgi:nucleoside-diphosphate-sugar epimerase